MILTAITFVLSSVFGWWLIKSVKSENRRKEQLQIMANPLAEGNDKLQKLDNAKSEFLSIASHQLRTPPTAIKGYSSLLLEGSYGKLTPEQSAALNNVYKRNEDMITLIDNLLETSRIESETIKFEPKKFKLEDLLKDIYETLIFKAKEKKLSLEFIPPKEPLPEIVTDKDKFREVVSNLVDNAVKYTKEGGVKVQTELQKGFTALSHDLANPVPIDGAEKEDQEKDVIRITVSDTGIGIPATELPFLFQKFSRGKDISRLNVSGTGLGLFVGKEIMEALGGHVWAESEGEGKGSTFVVEIPVEKEEKKGEEDN
jgi:signal transduction histidine kinase